MGAENLRCDFTVIGAGVFGLYAGIVLGREGLSGQIFEADEQIFNRASRINQARLHTGMHYPRSRGTALASLEQYGAFKDRFPTALRSFNHVYGVSKFMSSTSARAYRNFIEDIGIPAQEIPVETYFSPVHVEAAWSVDEPSFDFGAIRQQLFEEIQELGKVEIVRATRVVGAKATSSEVVLDTTSGMQVKSRYCVIAAYAGTNSLRRQLGLESIPLQYELAEVVLGRVSDEYRNLGMTVMDGPFWSSMPYGNSGLHTMTTVGFTPNRVSLQDPRFPCQKSNPACTPIALQDCQGCSARPFSNALHHVQQAYLYTKNSDWFTPLRSEWTVKSVLSTSQTDDGRPSIFIREERMPVATIFSGKVSTIFEMDEPLKDMVA